MTTEHKTTSVTYQCGFNVPNPDPIAPDGDGWKLRGGTSSQNPVTGEITVQWFWERAVATTQSDEGECLTQELTAPQ